MRKEPNRFDEIEEFIRRLVWLLIGIFGAIGVLLFAAKQLIDTWKFLW